jgi:NADH dehydrogenase FAD-containing subunit
MLRVTLVHSGPVILPELGESLGRYTQEVLVPKIQIEPALANGFAD